MDDLSALLGMGLEDEEELRALADSLRGRKRAADFFAATTVMPLREAANREQASIQEAAGQAGVLKKALEERRSREREGAADRASRERIAGQHDAAVLKAAGIRAANKAKTGESPYGWLKTKPEREEFKSRGATLAKVNSIVGSWKPEYGPAIQAPGVGTVENLWGRYMPSKNSLKEQAAWWAAYEEHMAMLKRHAMFGSAFTQNEKASWERATITPSTDPRLIEAKLGTMQKLAQIDAEKAVIDAYEAGVSPEMIMLHYGNVVDVDELVDMWRNNPEAYAEKRRKDDEEALKFNMKMEQVESGKGVLDEYAPEEAAAPASGWSEEDERRYQELKARAGNANP